MLILNPEVITIGSNTLDCSIQVKDILRFELFDKDIVKKYTAIEYSRKLNVEALRFFPGGSGANIAADCAMLGLKTAYVGIVGYDFSAQICLEDLKKRGVDLSNVIQTRDDNTAFSLILKTEWGKDRSILAYKGANNLLKPEHIKADIFKGIKAFAWTSLTSESGCKSIDKAISLTKENNGLVFAAPSMSIIKNNPQWAKLLISKSDVVSMNTEEAMEFTNENEKFFCAKKLLELGPGLVSITDGANGSLITDGTTIIRSGIYKVDVKDTTGAGDAFLSGILISKLKNYTTEKMAKLATAMSSFEAMEVGVRQGLSTSLEELEKFIQKNKLTQSVSKLSEL
ncbi:MAG: carbohydrate kinase family protein [Candidatus Thorarchaeota archaeon]